MIKGRKLGHIGFAVDCVDENAKWYKDNMGFEEIARFQDSNGNVYFLKNGNVIYEMYQCNDLTADARGKVDHVAYESSDIEADFEYCKDQGYTFITNGIESIPNFWDNGYKYFMFATPAGDRVEIGQIL